MCVARDKRAVEAGPPLVMIEVKSLYQSNHTFPSSNILILKQLTPQSVFSDTSAFHDGYFQSYLRDYLNSQEYEYVAISWF